MNAPFRIGHGYDLHQLTNGRKLILGGVEIPHERGLLGHSDADCLIHALADAMFGALGLLSRTLFPRRQSGEQGHGLRSNIGKGDRRIQVGRV